MTSTNATTATTRRPWTGLADEAWARFALRRLGRLLVSVWVLVTAAFLMIHLVPGDPVRAALGLTAPQDLVEARRAQLGLNDPLWLQYVHYVRNLFTGQLGMSMSQGLPVSKVIGDRILNTVELAGLAFVVAILIAVPLGLTMALLTRGGRRRPLELAYTSTSVVLAAVPDLVIGEIFVAVFALGLKWFPVAGREGASSYVLPVLALAIGPAAVLSRIVRLETLAVLQTDFIRTARAKRLPRRLILLRHALPNAITASFTLGGLLLGGLVASTVLVENVFAWPGLGLTIVQSILAKDYPLVQGIVLVYGLTVLLVNLAVDVGLALLDPRSTIRES